jgi:single-stranded DNA-specific DHH superfamily exonuclease
MEPAESEVAIIYHGGCVDGETAKALLLEVYPTAISIGCQPSEGPNFNHLKGKYIIMVDITFSQILMAQLFRMAKKLFVIDHHPTGAHNCHKLPDRCYYVSEQHCGAVLTWSWINAARDRADNKLDWIGAPFQPANPGGASTVLQLIDIRDRNGPAVSMQANALHALLAQNLTSLGRMIYEDPEALVKQGMSLLQQVEHFASSLMGNVRLLNISIRERTYLVAAINSPIFGSELLHLVRNTIWQVPRQSAIDF